MDIGKKYVTAKKLILTALIIDLSWDIVLKILNSHGYVEYQTGHDSWWVAIGFFIAVGLFLYGLWLGSRGIGEPLSFRLFWNLLSHLQKDS